MEGCNILMMLSALGPSISATQRGSVRHITSKLKVSRYLTKPSFGIVSDQSRISFGLYLFKNPFLCHSNVRTGEMVASEVITGNSGSFNANKLLKYTGLRKNDQKAISGIHIETARSAILVIDNCIAER